MKKFIIISSITLSIIVIIVAGFFLGTNILETKRIQKLHSEFAVLRTKSSAGDVESQVKLGRALKRDSFGYFGDIFTWDWEELLQNRVEAVKWFSEAAEQGSAEAMVYLGEMYYLGWGVAQDYSESMRLYRRAAELDYPEAYMKLALVYIDGEAVTRDYEEGMRLYSKALEHGYDGVMEEFTHSQHFADMGNSFGQWANGWKYYYGVHVAQDYLEAEKWFRKAADQGDSASQWFLGNMYSDGEGVEKDDIESVKWYRKAAEQGMAKAQFSLGTMYYYGNGVSQDVTEAVKWYRKAAEQGLAIAQARLGNRYYDGKGVTQDFLESSEWYRKAAEQGHANSQLMLGYFYYQGKGVAQDFVESVKWYRKSAIQGEPLSQFSLGNMYSDGEGVEKDDIESVKWYRKAAEQGMAKAQFNLSLGYLLGRGIAKDEVEAYKWILLAVSQGLDDNGITSSIEESLTPSFRIEGQRRAREWKPRKTPESVNSFLEEDNVENLPSNSGTGFVITENGYFITNHHVVERGGKIQLLTQSGIVSAKIVKVDVANDLALLKAEGNFNPLPLISSRSVRLGATVSTIGFPNIDLQGFAPKLSKGEIAALSGAGDDARHFQISTPIQPGNSGGALVDDRGNVVGVIVAKLSQEAAIASSGTIAENVNYAVKGSYLLSFLEAIPVVSNNLKQPYNQQRSFEDVAQGIEAASVLVLVY